MRDKLTITSRDFLDDNNFRSNLSEKMDHKHSDMADVSANQGLSREEIAISGIAGRYPDSDSSDEFGDKLFNAHNFVSVNDSR